MGTVGDRMVSSPSQQIYPSEWECEWGCQGLCQEECLLSELNEIQVTRGNDCNGLWNHTGGLGREKLGRQGDRRWVFFQLICGLRVFHWYLLLHCLNWVLHYCLWHREDGSGWARPGAFTQTDCHTWGQTILWVTGQIVYFSSHALL